MPAAASRIHATRERDYCVTQQSQRDGDGLNDFNFVLEEGLVPENDGQRPES
jgi:hypothetical protein